MSQLLSAESPTARTKAQAKDGVRPTLLFFSSPTSGAARRVDGFLAQVLQRRGNHSTFKLVNVDATERPDLCERYGVTEIPTLVVVEDGTVRARIPRPSGCVAIADQLTPWLK